MLILKFNRIVLIIFMAISTSVFAQDKLIKLVGVEAGYYSLTAYTEDLSFIRKNAGTNYPSNSIFLDGLNNTGHFGFKFEVLTQNKKFALHTGLRYTYMSNRIEAVNNDGAKSYVLFYHRSTNNSTEYLRVQKISDKQSFVSVPLSFKFSPFIHSSGLVAAYAKLTFQFNANIYSKNNAEFFNEEMDQYSESVFEQINDPSAFSGMLFLSHGIRIGDLEKLSVAIELIFPAVEVFGNMTSLYSTDNGVGFQLTLQKAI